MTIRSAHKTSKYYLDFTYSSYGLVITILKSNGWMWSIGVRLHLPSTQDEKYSTDAYFSLMGMADAKAYHADRKLIDMMANTRDVDKIIDYAKSLMPKKVAAKAKVAPAPKLINDRPLQLDMFAPA